MIIPAYNASDILGPCMPAGDHLLPCVVGSQGAVTAPTLRREMGHSLAVFFNMPGKLGKRRVLEPVYRVVGAGRVAVAPPPVAPAILSLRHCRIPPEPK